VKNKIEVTLASAFISLFINNVYAESAGSLACNQALAKGDVATALVQAGYPEQAQMAVSAAQKMLESQATVVSKTRENLSTMGKLQSERDRLLSVNPNDPRIAEYNKAIAAEGSSRTPQLSVDAKMFDFGAGRRDVFLKEVNPLITQGAAVNQGLTLIEQGTPFAQAAFESAPPLPVIVVLDQPKHS
jgi:hypothetical protein